MHGMPSLPLILALPRQHFATCRARLRLAIYGCRDSDADDVAARGSHRFMRLSRRESGLFYYFAAATDAMPFRGADGRALMRYLLSA